MLRNQVFVIDTHKVPTIEAETRLYDYCTGIFSDYIPSRKGIKKALKRGEIYVDGSVGRSGDWVKEGQLIELCDLELNPPKPYDMAVEVVFEDEHLAVVNKPAGIPVSGNQYRTMQNVIIGQLRKSSEKDALKWPRPVHRLDSPTSGLLMIAKTASAILKLSEQFRNRAIQKTYHAVVMGSPADKGEMTFPVNGQDAHSSFEKIDEVKSLQSGTLSLLKLMPHTGHTHQLRIHCAESGFPILGDTQYGPKGNTLLHKGLFLCATELDFEHPASGKRNVISINPPAKFIGRLKKEAERWEKFKG